MTHGYLIGLSVMGGVAVALGLLCLCLWVHRWFGRRFAWERRQGNMQVRWHMQARLGRGGYEYVSKVWPAESLPGWVWIAMTRHPPDPQVTRLGWAPFEWLAKRALVRYRKREACDEQGRVSLALVVGLCVMVAILFPGLGHAILHTLIQAIAQLLEGLRGYLLTS